MAFQRRDYFLFLDIPNLYDANFQMPNTHHQLKMKQNLLIHYALSE
jgi:hypothetical protein